MFTLPAGRAAPLLFLALAGLAACSPAAEGNQLSTPTVALTPYQSATATSGLQESATPAFTEPPLATPTPITHVIAQGETLLGIAQAYGITLNALQAANPGVNAALLSIGQEILVPHPEAGSPDEIPSPTPAAATLDEVACYPTAAGELFCFLLVSNTNDQALENLSGILRFFDASGEELGSADLVSPLNLLPSQAALPLVAFVAEPPANWSSLRGRLLTAYISGNVANRYLSADFQDEQVEIAENGLQARLQGAVAIGGTAQAGTVWVLAVAYDAEGAVVGQRRWESDSGQLAFDFYVYSLGPEIDSVDLLLEVRP